MIQRRAALTGVALPRHRISPAASRTLLSWVDGLASGDLQLWQLPDAVCAIYHLGYQHGAASRDDEMHRLRVDADRLWLLAMPETARRAFILDRLDDAARLTNSPEVDDHLDAAWSAYLDSLNTLQEPVRLASTEHGRKAA